MADISVKSRVESLIGEIGDNDTVEVSKWASDTAREVINILPQDMLWSVSAEKTDSGSGVSVTTAKFLYAHKGGYEAREILPSMKSRASDSNSIYNATTSSPVYYREVGKVNVIPSGGTAVVVNYPVINYDDSDVTGVPDDVKHLVIMGTAVKGRMNQLNDLRDGIKKISSPSYDIPAIVLDSLPSITDLSLSEAVPTLVLPPSPSLSSLSISVQAPVAPSSPSFSDNTYSKVSNPPVYTAPVFTGDFSQTETYIRTDEDVELANAELQKVLGQINRFNQDISNSVNEFNEKSTEFQAEVSRASENARISQDKETQEYGSKLSRYGAELQKYTAELNAEVQEHTVNNIQQDLQKWQSEQTAALQKYSADLQKYAAVTQNEKEVYTINEIQKQISLYTVEQGNRLAKFGSEIQNRSQLFQSEFGVYNKEIDTEFQKHAAMMQELQILHQQYQQGLQMFVQSYTLPKGGNIDG